MTIIFFLEVNSKYCAFITLVLYLNTCMDSGYKWINTKLYFHILFTIWLSWSDQVNQTQQIWPCQFDQANSTNMLKRKHNMKGCVNLLNKVAFSKRPYFVVCTSMAFLGVITIIIKYSNHIEFVQPGNWLWICEATTFLTDRINCSRKITVWDTEVMTWISRHHLRPFFKKISSREGLFKKCIKNILCHQRKSVEVLCACY